jgi:8-oxo-dGTP diphosphatase
MVQNHTSVRTEIERMVHSLVPFDTEEQEHLTFTNDWIASGAEIFRTAKPAIPDPHLVSYFLLVDGAENKVLLVDHKKAGLWLPAGGHVEVNEHPKETVKREITEELGIQADFLSHNSFFLTKAKTVGQTAGHTDISLWYILKGCSSATYAFDKEEFLQVRWFSPTEIPYERSDPHLMRCIKKLISLGLLHEK